MFKRSHSTRDEAIDEVLVAQLVAVFDVARRLTGSKSEAEDLTQETYGRALAAAERFEQGSSARAWLLTILHNLFRNRVRDDSRHRAVELDDELELTVTADDEPEWAGLTPQMLDEGIAALPLKLREAVVLRDLQGLSYRQVAEVLNVPSGTVMSRLHRGRAQLKQVLSQQLAGSSPSQREALMSRERIEAPREAGSVDATASDGQRKERR